MHEDFFDLVRQTLSDKYELWRSPRDENATPEFLAIKRKGADTVLARQYVDRDFLTIYGSDNPALTQMMIHAAVEVGARFMFEPKTEGA